MTLTQRLTIRTSEQRSRLAELAGLDELTDEQRAELGTLGTEHQDTEAQLRAAIASAPDADPTVDPTVDPEVRERLELRGRASLGRYLAAMLTGQPIGGAEAEYQAACKTPGIPIDLFEQDRPEIRADTASGVPATGVGTTVAPIQPFVFSQSIAPMLGIEMPTVGSGSYSEMTISTSLTAAAKSKATAQESTAAVLTPATATPRSIRGRLTLNLEDIAAIGQANFESALRQNAQAVVSDALDTQVITGNGTAPNLDGLIQAVDRPDRPDHDREPSMRSWRSVRGCHRRVMGPDHDGRRLGMVDERRRLQARGEVVPRQNHRHGPANGGVSLGNKTAADYLRKAYTGGFWTNEAYARNGVEYRARHRAIESGRMGLRTACLPTWGSIAVDDIYSDAQSGQRHFTLNILVGSKVLLVQPDAYKLDRTEGQRKGGRSRCLSPSGNLPGCADLIADDLQEIVDGGGVVIDAGRIAESLGWNPTDPDRNMDLLRVALGMRTTAIKIATRAGAQRCGPNVDHQPGSGRTSDGANGRGRAHDRHDAR